MKKSQRTKQRLVEAAIRVIMREGIEHVSVNQVIEEAGSSKGSFYYYFKDLDALLQAAFLYNLERSLQDFSIEADKSMQENLRLFGQYLIDSATDKRSELAMMFLWISKCYQDDGLRASFAKMQSSIVDHNSVTEQFVRQYELSAEKLLMLDMAVLGLLVHAMMLEDREQLLSVWVRLSEAICQLP
ncbi:TetR/AcrR family transcriptional regulator [Marinicrinis sediminis]|uniref:TetR/AcrR family transcriptional regulator n=1 Tax=Marinicrinis sediminis TaxID=1652465 RepID=A0ABW5R685_9BACL